MEYIKIIVLGYIIGCFQTSYIISKIFIKKDIRNLGNGNAGASNMTVSFGWKYGILVAILDVAKAAIPIFILKEFSKAPELNFMIYLMGLSVILGHNFPFYMNFKGGKGTASLIGVLLGIDFKLGLLGIIIIALVTIISDYIALGTMALIIYFSLATFLLDFGKIPFIISFIIGSMSFLKHIENIKNIISGKERGLRSTINRREKDE